LPGENRVENGIFGAAGAVFDRSLHAARRRTWRTSPRGRHFQ
jgi:hypothetical protein